MTKTSLFGRALVAASLILALQPTADAQITFADLRWGSSVSTVHSKLKAQGYSGCYIWERLICAVLSDCSCTFEGHDVMEGDARFYRGQLGELRLFVGDYRQYRDELDSKYGRPYHSQATIVSRNNPSRVTWRSANGDTLDGSGVFLEYRSAARNRAIDAETIRRPSHF